MDFLANFFSFMFLTLWIVIWISFIVVVFRIIVDVFRDTSLSGGVKALWVAFVVIFPIIGALSYLISRGQGMAQRDMKDAAAIREAQVEYTRGLMNEAGPSAEIKAGKDLLDSGAISQAEFDALKAKALA